MFLQGLCVKVSDNSVPSIEAEVWKELAAGLHDPQGDAAADSLSRAGNLDIHGGAQEDGYNMFSTAYVCAPHWTALQRRDVTP